MTLAPNDECLILSGRRLVSHECGDFYFQFVANEIRRGGKSLFDICRAAVQLCGAGRMQCAGCD